jgi:hypothetical protein
MKLSKQKALLEITKICALACARMEQGVEKYGEELILEGKNQSLLEEFDNEIADAINYMVFAREKFKNAMHKMEVIK